MVLALVGNDDNGAGSGGADSDNSSGASVDGGIDDVESDGGYGNGNGF